MESMIAESVDPFATPRTAAHFYADKGWRVIPTSGNVKHPTRKKWQELATTDHEEIDQLFDQGHDQDVCVATGSGSGVFVVDVDPKAGGDESLQALFESYGPFPETPMVLTGGDGFHYYFKFPEEVDIRNESGRSLGPGIDIRSDRGQVSAPPTLHPSGKRYEWEASSDPQVVEPAEPPTWLVELLVSENDSVGAPRREKANRSDEERLPGDVWMDNHSWADMLEEVGATFQQSRDGEEYWMRPPMPHETSLKPHNSATLYHKGSDVLKLFTPNWAPLEDGETYDKARFYVAYHPDDFFGDTLDEKMTSFFTAVNQEAHGEEWKDWFLQQEAEFLAQSEATAKEQSEQDISWKPQSLREARNLPAPAPPEVLTRTDLVSLLYKGKLNYMFGLPGCGKSWAAQFATYQVANVGGDVLYIDFENDVRSYEERLRVLGLQEFEYDHVSYVNPDRRIDLRSVDVDPVMKVRRDAFIELLKKGYELVVVDGVSNAMGLLGYDPVSNSDAILFETNFLRPLISFSGAALVCIDHAPKNSGETSTIFGAQHKLAQVTGASFEFKTVVPFGREMTGKSKISLVKDKPGHLRQFALAGGYIGDLVIDSSGDSATATILAPLIEGNIPDSITQSVANWIRDNPNCYESEMMNGVKGSYSFKKAALKKLVDDGYVGNDVGRGRLYMRKPYGEQALTVEDLVAGNPQDRGPNVVQKERKASDDPIDQSLSRVFRDASKLGGPPTHTMAFPDDGPRSDDGRPADRPRVPKPEEVKAQVEKWETHEGFNEAAKPKPAGRGSSPRDFYMPDVQAARARVNRTRQLMGKEELMDEVGITGCSRCGGGSTDPELGGPCSECGGRGYLDKVNNVNNKVNKAAAVSCRRDSVGSGDGPADDDDFLDDLDGSGGDPLASLPGTPVPEAAPALVFGEEARRADEPRYGGVPISFPFSQKGGDEWDDGDADEESLDADGRNWKEDPWGDPWEPE
jgi:hypothetical protein